MGRVVKVTRSSSLTGFSLSEQEKTSKRVECNPEKGWAVAGSAPKPPHNLEPFKLNDLQIEPMRSSIPEAAVLLTAITAKVLREEDESQRLWEGRKRRPWNCSSNDTEIWIPGIYWDWNYLTLHTGQIRSAHYILINHKWFLMQKYKQTPGNWDEHVWNTKAKAKSNNLNIRWICRSAKFHF